MQLVLNEAFITLISMFVNLSMPRLLHADHTHPNFNRNKHLTHCFRVLYLYDTISMTANIQIIPDLMTDPHLTPLYMFGFM